MSTATGASSRGLAARDLDIVFGNESELCSLMEVDDLERACALIRRPGLLVSVTRGAKGAWVFEGEDGAIVDVRVQAARRRSWTPRGPATSTPPGSCSGLTAGRDLPTCARLGNAAAAEVISHMGARPETDLLSVIAPSALGA